MPPDPFQMCGLISRMLTLAALKNDVSVAFSAAGFDLLRKPANSLTRCAISTLDCRNNFISDAVNIRGVKQITCFRLCKAVKSEAESLIPPIFELLSMF